MAELIAGMLNASRYKRSQGKVARQATFLAVAIAIAIGGWRLSSIADPDDQIGRFLLPVAIVAIGCWAAFRIVNIPRFADFLISVEAEMNKVSWPSRAELYRASMVVLVVIFILVVVLFFFDVALREILQRLDGVLTWLGL